jgi:hypothetical protein
MYDELAEAEFVLVNVSEGPTKLHESRRAG